MMASLWWNITVQPLVLACIFLAYVEAVYRPALIKAPSNTVVQEKETATFTCIVANITKNFNMYWELTSVKADKGQIHKIDGKLQNKVSLHDTNDQIQMVTNTYRWISSNLQELTLHFHNVTRDISLFVRCDCCNKFPDIHARQLPCGYLPDVWATLTVLSPLLCSYTYPSVNKIVPKEGVRVNLTCHLEDYNPNPAISWWNSARQQISSNKTMINSFSYQLLSSDNGKEFICKASLPKLSKPLQCSVIPYHIFPIAVVQPVMQKISSKMADAKIVCENMGDATLDTYFEWSLGTKESVTIATSDKISNLTICNLSELLNNTIITCQVVVPLVATSNASATVIIYDDELIPSSDVTPTPGITTDNSSHTMPPNDTYHTSVGTVVTISLIVSSLFIICVLAFLCGLFIGKRRVSSWNILHRHDSDPVYTSVQNVNQHPQSESEVSEASAMQSLTGSNIQLHAPDNQTELRMKDDRSYANPDFSSSESDMTVQDGIFCPIMLMTAAF